MSENKTIQQHPDWDKPSLDMEFLACELDIPYWDVLMLTAPKITKIGKVLESEWSQDTVQESANWGMILKLGDAAYEAKRLKGLPPPYSPGDWVLFNEFRPEPRRINNVPCYFIPDGKIMARMRDPEKFIAYHYVKSQLPVLKQQALALISNIHANEIRGSF